MSPFYHFSHLSFQVTIVSFLIVHFSSYVSYKNMQHHYFTIMFMLLQCDMRKSNKRRNQSMLAHVVWKVLHIRQDMVRL